MSLQKIIDFNRPHQFVEEQEYINQAYQNSKISGAGSFSKKCQAILEQETGSSKVVLSTSCTHALEMTALLLDFKPGDEVIIPAFTFVSTVNAFVLRGATPVFIDCRPDTLNLDETILESKITPKTRAIITMHYSGVACEMNRILEIAARYHLPVIEDNAHGLFGKYQGKPLGSFGCMATQSFHETKNISCGEGGALVINDPALIERAEILREKGTDRSRFFRGMVDKYTWVDVGSSYILSEILAAVLFAHLEHRKEIQRKRTTIWLRYASELHDWAAKAGVRLPIVPDGCEHPAHIFYMLLPSLNIRQSMMDYLKQNGVICVFHYQPLHLSTMGRKLGGKPGDCPVTEDVSDRLLRLPIFYDLSEEDQYRAIQLIKNFKFD